MTHLLAAAVDYLVATYRDRIAAEGAYVAAEKAGIPLDAVRLVGRGYDGLDDVALWDKDVAAWKQIRMLLLWLLPFGFVAGTAFNLITRIGMISPLVDPVIGGFLGMGSAAMGAFFVGGGVGLTTNRRPSVRQRLEDGQYLLVIAGEWSAKGVSLRCLQQTRPLDLQEFSLTAS